MTGAAFVVGPPGLVDEPPAIRLAGLAPAEAVTVEATFDLAGTSYRSAASFVADGDGVVDLATSPSAGGSYEGVDPYGLLWSADATGPAGGPPFDPVEVHLSAAGASAVVTRHWLRDGATLAPVDELHGLYARPGGDGPFPAVVAFGGSGGGFGPAASWVALLASHGVAALALAYFGGPGLPAALESIEVEVVARAVDWLRARPEVGRDARPMVMGQSRGSELALLAAAAFPDRIGGAVSFSGSGLVWPALGPNGPMDAPAWTLAGEPLPYLRDPGATMPDPGDGTTAAELTSRHLAGLRYATEEAQIPVERIAGPILAVSGDDDAMWPSVELTAVAEERARAKGFAHGLTHLRFPGAGHTAPGPPGVPVFTEVVHPVVGQRLAFGGTRPAVHAARVASWPTVVAFVGGRV